MPPRDPLSVAYDGEVRAFLTLVATTGSAIPGAVVIPGGSVSPRTGISSRYVLVAVPPGGDPVIYQRAWTASLQYNFRVMFGPVGPTGRPLRENVNGNWVYVRGPWWVHMDWRGPGLVRGLAGMGGVIRIGPQSARPRITGAESYIDNPR